MVFPGEDLTNLNSMRWQKVLPRRLQFIRTATTGSLLDWLCLTEADSWFWRRRKTATRRNKEKTEGSRGLAANKVLLLLIKSLTLIMQTSQSEFRKTSLHKNFLPLPGQSAAEWFKMHRIRLCFLFGCCCCFVFGLFFPPTKDKYNKSKKYNWQRSKQNYTELI